MTNYTLLDILIIAAAAHRLTRLINEDTFPPVARIREWVLVRWPSDDTRFDDDQATPDPDTSNTGVSVTGIPLIHITTRTEAGSLDTGWWPTRSHWFGELVTCSWCTGVWVSGIVVAGWELAPWSRWLWLVLAVATVVGLMRERVG